MKTCVDVHRHGHRHGHTHGHGHWHGHRPKHACIKCKTSYSIINGVFQESMRLGDAMMFKILSSSWWFSLSIISCLLSSPYISFQKFSLVKTAIYTAYSSPTEINQSQLCVYIYIYIYIYNNMYHTKTRISLLCIL